jgi:hypothetical protein
MPITRANVQTRMRIIKKTTASQRHACVQRISGLLADARFCKMRDLVIETYGSCDSFLIEVWPAIVLAYPERLGGALAEVLPALRVRKQIVLSMLQYDACKRCGWIHHTAHHCVAH